MSFKKILFIITNFLVIFFCQYLLELYIPSSFLVQKSIAPLAVAGLALSAAQVGTGIAGMFGKKPDPIEIPDPTKTAEYQEQKKALSTAAAMGTGIDQRRLNLSSARTSQGIEAAMEAGKSANYLSDINKFVEQQREADIALGIEAAQRQEQRKKDYMDFLSTSQQQQMDIAKAKMGLQEQAHQAYAQKKKDAWGNVIGGATSAIGTMETYGIGTGKKAGTGTGTGAETETETPE